MLDPVDRKPIKIDNYRRLQFTANSLALHRSHMFRYFKIELESGINHFESASFDLLSFNRLQSR